MKYFRLKPQEKLVFVLNELRMSGDIKVDLGSFVLFYGKVNKDQKEKDFMLSEELSERLDASFHIKNGLKADEANYNSFAKILYENKSDKSGEDFVNFLKKNNAKAVFLAVLKESPLVSIVWTIKAIDNGLIEGKKIIEKDANSDFVEWPNKLRERLCLGFEEKNASYLLLLNHLEE